MEDLSKDKKQFEEGMTEILQALKDAQQNAPAGTSVTIPSLERLVDVSVVSCVKAGSQCGVGIVHQNMHRIHFRLFFFPQLNIFFFFFYNSYIVPYI